MTPTKEFYDDLVAMREHFQDDDLLMEVALNAKEILLETPATDLRQKRLEVLAAVIAFLEQKRH